MAEQDLDLKELLGSKCAASVSTLLGKWLSVLARGSKDTKQPSNPGSSHMLPPDSNVTGNDHVTWRRQQARGQAKSTIQGCFGIIVKYFSVSCTGGQVHLAKPSDGQKGDKTFEVQAGQINASHIQWKDGALWLAENHHHSVVSW